MIKTSVFLYKAFFVVKQTVFDQNKLEPLQQIVPPGMKRLGEEMAPNREMTGIGLHHCFGFLGRLLEREDWLGSFLVLLLLQLKEQYL